MKDYSNYYGVSTNDRLIHDGKLLFKRSLRGLESYDVLVGTETVRVNIENRFNSSGGYSKYVYTDSELIDYGTPLKWNDENWLVASKPEANAIFKKAEIGFCNHLFPITTIESVRVDTGKLDWRKQPIYEVIEQAKTDYIPCIAESKIITNKTQEAINMPEGQLILTLPYTEHEDIRLDESVILYKENYKIIHIDWTNSYEGKGIIKLTVEREVVEDATS
ncbi:hypothetical protein BEH_07230 [Priestia filamentosa]|uniref:Uncharacterized protein n=1 Tax=Priestia filamentosa TaxID=1402861 RepID=A0A0H4KGH8_9BACI|nr:hypothetical protein [Priestia filamentosa]AKO91911.1 hypothetical protein BEH_07230 [Priestia filamentosa]